MPTITYYYLHIKTDGDFGIVVEDIECFYEDMFIFTNPSDLKTFTSQISGMYVNRKHSSRAAGFIQRIKKHPGLEGFVLEGNWSCTFGKCNYVKLDYSLYSPGDQEDDGDMD